VNLNRFSVLVLLFLAMDGICSLWSAQPAEGWGNNTVARLQAQLLLKMFTGNEGGRQRDLVPFPDAQAFTVKSRDGITIAGWSLRAKKKPLGSVVLIHGFAANSCMYQLPATARWLSDHGWDLCAPDLRFHGLSDDGVTTFGTAESWDISATLDKMEHDRFPRPYLLVGQSLGAMSAQRCAIGDRRVAGAALFMPPAWPWHAIERMPREMGLDGSAWGKGSSKLATVIYETYEKDGCDILNDGDLRNHDPSPSHRPKVLYLMGDRDIYGIEETRQIWGHWYPSERAKSEVWPSQAPRQNKWFITVPNAGHNLPFSWPDKTHNLLADWLQTVIK